MIKNWKAILGVILIFVLGFLAGIVGSSIVFHKKMEDFLRHPGVAVVAAVERRLTRNLNLDASQRQQIHGYFMDNLQAHLQLQKQIAPQVKALNHQTLQQISAVLRPDQLALFNQNVAEGRRRLTNGIMPANDDSSSSPGILPAISATNSATATPPGQ